MSIKENWLRVYIIGVLLILCSLPFSIAASKIFMLLTSVIWLINPYGQIRVFNKEHIRYVVAICSGYFLLFIGLIHTDNIDKGLHIIDAKFPILVLPIIIIFSTIRNKDVKLIFTAFCISVVLACLYSLFASYQFYKVSRNIDEFLYLDLVKHLNIHPNYLALYVTISLFHLIYLFKNQTKAVRLLILIGIIFLLIINFLLLSRIMMLAFLVSSILVFVFFFEIRYKFVYMTSFVISIAFLFFIAYTNSETFKSRIKDALSFGNYTHEPVWTSSSGIHFKCWSCAVESLTSNILLFGHGTGDEVDVLMRCYEEKNWNEMVNQKLNSHNEYLSSIMRCGMLGLFTLLIVLVQSLYFSIKFREFVLFAFVLCVSFFFITGSLNLTHGVIFFGLVNALLIKRCLTLRK